MRAEPWRLACGAAVATSLLCSPLAASQTPAPNWRASSVTQMGRTFIDTNSISREGERVMFVREVRFTAPRPLTDTQQFNRIMERYEADCAASTLRRLWVQGFMDEAVVAPGRDRAEAPQPAGPGTAAAVDLRAVCLGQWPNRS